MEMYTKQYMLKHKRIWSQIEVIRNQPIWYDEKKVRTLYSLLQQVVRKQESIALCNSNAKKVAVNQEIKETLKKLEKL